MMPGVVHYGVSRKITEEAERDRLRKLLDELQLPANVGFIVRTAGAKSRKADLQRDLGYLHRLWEAVEERIRNTQPPALVYQESDFVMRCMRDVFSADVEEIVIDSEDVCRQVSEFLRMIGPSQRKLVKLYRGAAPIFDHYQIEQQIQNTFSNVVPLKSGGSIVIDQAEAMVAIDVNSGRCTNESDIEETAFRTNIEAAREAARQLRLRDMGGVIVIDFIDMRLEKHRREVEKAMTNELKKDRARSRVLRMSRFGLMQITRQRVRQGTKLALFDPCPTCSGSGLVRSVESMVPHVMRHIRLALSKKDVEAVDVSIHPDAAEQLSNSKRQDLGQMEAQTRCKIRVLARQTFRPGQCEVICHFKNGKKAPL
jgi:ribonuclease E